MALPASAAPDTALKFLRARSSCAAGGNGEAAKRRSQRFGDLRCKRGEISCAEHRSASAEIGQHPLGEHTLVEGVRTLPAQDSEGFGELGLPEDIPLLARLTLRSEHAVEILGADEIAVFGVAEMLGKRSRHRNPS